MAASAGGYVPVSFLQEKPAMDAGLIFSELVRPDIILAHLSDVCMASGTQGWDIPGLGPTYKAPRLAHGPIRVRGRRVSSMAIRARDSHLLVDAGLPLLYRASEFPSRLLMAGNAEVLHPPGQARSRQREDYKK